MQTCLSKVQLFWPKLRLVLKMSNRAAKKKDPDFSFINVLSATIAIINAEGEIVAVNEAWRKFAIENDFPNHSNAGVGTNYLDTCQKSLMNLNDAEAGRAIKGIQEVINGVRNTFTMVYPCHSPTVSRWFRMEVGMAEPDGPFFPDRSSGHYRSSTGAG